MSSLLFALIKVRRNKQRLTNELRLPLVWNPNTILGGDRVLDLILNTFIYLIPMLKTHYVLVLRMQ